MKYKTSYLCLFAGIAAFGFLGMANAEDHKSKQTQSISFNPASASINVGGTLVVTASSSSHLSVSLSLDSTTANYCSFDPNTGLVTGKAAGTCKINAFQGGSSSYVSATGVLSIPVKQVQLQAQTISFGAAPVITVGGSGTVTATASSGLKVLLASTTPTVCSLSGNTVTGLTVGTCTISANQGGDSTYVAATQAVQSFSVTQKVGSDGNGGSGGSTGGSKLAVTAPFNCATLASSGNASDDGRRAYNRLNCISCHGQDGSGGMGPNIKGAGSDVAEAVNGEGAMPSFAGFLCPNDVTDLEAYLGSTTKTVKYLDWDAPIEQIVDGAIAPTPTDVVVGP